MWKLQNEKTKKFVKDAITAKIKIFDDLETAERFKLSMERISVLEATAWNSIRKSSYTVVTI